MIVINLNSEQGDSLYLIDKAKNLIKELKIEQLEQVILKDMCSGDYHNLIKMFRHYFKEYIKIIE